MLHRILLALWHHSAILAQCLKQQEAAWWHCEGTPFRIRQAPLSMYCLWKSTPPLRSPSWATYCLLSFLPIWTSGHQKWNRKSQSTVDWEARSASTYWSSSRTSRILSWLYYYLSIHRRRRWTCFNTSRCRKSFFLGEGFQLNREQ